MSLPFRSKVLVRGALAIALGLAMSPLALAANLKSMSAHVVVQFTESINNPGAAEFIDDLATRVGAPLAYLRPTGAHAHLLLIRHLNNNHQLEQVMEALSRDQVVVTVRQRGKLEPERQ